jgi:Uncharacterized protein conserved in bacteria
MLVLLSSVGGLLLSSSPQTVSADALSDAYAKKQELQKLINQQKAAIRALTASQATLSTRISGTKASLKEINANLQTVKTQIVGMVVDVARSQNAVDELVATAGRLDAELADIEAEEATKQAELDASKALLASRIKEAYDADRTSIFDTVLSSADFTDVLTEVGYHLDFAQQDKLLADQIVSDQQVLDVLHQNVVLARDQTTQLHDLAAASKAELDSQLADLAAARKQLAAMEAETARLLNQQQTAFAQLQHDKTKLAAASRRSSRPRRSSRRGSPSSSPTRSPRAASPRSTTERCPGRLPAASRRSSGVPASGPSRPSAAARTSTAASTSRTRSTRRSTPPARAR